MQFQDLNNEIMSSSTKTIALVAVLLLSAERTYSQNYGDLRLVQGSRSDASFSAGRLEIFINSTWGTVCSDRFDLTDASVACRQLGFAGALSFETSLHTPYGRGRDGPVWLDEVECREDLLHLLSCANDGVGYHDCDHFSDVAIVCSSNETLLHDDDVEQQPGGAGAGDIGIRLSGGEFRSEGRVEVFCSENWATVCDQAADFGQDEADAVCRRLGYTEAIGFDASSAVVSAEDLLFPAWRGQLRLDCPLDEEDSNSTSSSCNGVCGQQISDVGAGDCSTVNIRCSHTVAYGMLRLVKDDFKDLDDDTTDTDTMDPDDCSHGRLEIFQSGKWGTVCSNSFDLLAANISCQELGFLRALRYQEEADLEAEDVSFGVDSESTPLTEFRCSEEDQRLVQCSRVVSPAALGGGNCTTHDRDVVLFCTNTPPVTPRPGTPPPDEGTKLPTTTLIGILVGIFLALLLLCICLAIFSAHFYLVPYSMKKERMRGLYFVEREGSAAPADQVVETTFDQKLSDLELSALEESLGKSGGGGGSQKRKKNKYVKFPVDSSSSTTQAAKADSSPPAADGQNTPPQLMQTDSSVPQPVSVQQQQQPLSSYSSPMDSPFSRVSVHSLHVLPDGTPQVHRAHPSGSPTSFPRGNPFSSTATVATSSSFSLTLVPSPDGSSSQSDVSRAATTHASGPIPTAIPIPPSLKQQVEDQGSRTGQDAGRSLVNSSFMSESEPALPRGQQQVVPLETVEVQPLFPSEQEEQQQQQQTMMGSSPLITSHTAAAAAGSQSSVAHGTPTKGIMKSPKSSAKPTWSMPQLSNRTDNASIRAANASSHHHHHHHNTDLELSSRAASEQPLHPLSSGEARSDNIATHHSHHVSFLLD